MKFVVEAEVTLDAPRERVFDVATRCETLVKYFRGAKPLIPGIVEASIEGGGPVKTGSLRPVKLSDGTRIKERVLAHVPPTLHGYDMLEMNLLQKLICTNMISEWRFTEKGSRTHILWHYEILPRNVLVEPITWVVSRFFQKAMQDCLNRLVVE